MLQFKESGDRLFFYLSHGPAGVFWWFWQNVTLLGDRFRPSRLSRGRDQEAQVFYDPYHSNFRDHETNGAGESRPRSGIYFLVAAATWVTKVKSRLYAPVGQ